jgi:hypothetical protein
LLISFRVLFFFFCSLGGSTEIQTYSEKSHSAQ